MKKLGLTAGTLILALSLIACGRDESSPQVFLEAEGEATAEEAKDEQEEATTSIGEVEEDEVVFVLAAREWRVNYPFTENFWEAWAQRPEPNARMRPFVEDFDYMIELLHNNFPFFAIAQRQFDVNVEELVWETRAVLLEPRYNIRDADDLWWVLWNYFTRHLQQIGHFAIQSHATLHLTLANVYRGGIGYDGQPLDLGDREFSFWGEIFRDLLYTELVWDTYGGFYIDLGEYEDGMIEPDNVTMEVLIPGEAAYISVARFIHYNINHDQELIFAFYEEIAGFEHLIIDLRGNPGGFTRYFIQNFMMPNLVEDIEFYVYSLFMAGEQNIPWVQASFDDFYLWNGYHINIWPVQEYTAGGFPYLNPVDMDFLDYIVPRHIRISSSGEMFFDGKIWILLDERSASAAEIAALYARAANFATIVGEPSRGVVGGGFVGMFALPNSGLVVRHDIGYWVDDYGRAINEYGVIPDIFNFEGMDALETVLTIILRVEE